MTKPCVVIGCQLARLLIQRALRRAPTSLPAFISSATPVLNHLCEQSRPRSSPSRPNASRHPEDCRLAEIRLRALQPCRPPKSQIKRMIGIGMPISQSNRPRPIFASSAISTATRTSASYESSTAPARGLAQRCQRASLPARGRLIRVNLSSPIVDYWTCGRCPGAQRLCVGKSRSSVCCESPTHLRILPPSSRRSMNRRRLLCLC